MYNMCVILCLFSALSCGVSAFHYYYKYMYAIAMEIIDTFPDFDRTLSLTLLFSWTLLEQGLSLSKVFKALRDCITCNLP